MLHVQVRDSEVCLAEAEQIVLEFVQRHVPEPGTAQVAGNSVHVDLAFLKRYMPRLAEHLHYRWVAPCTYGLCEGGLGGGWLCTPPS